MNALAAARSRASALSKSLSDQKSPTTAALNSGVILLGAAGAAALDAQVGEVAGQRPSVAGGIALAAAGFAMKSPKMLYAASGALAPTVYDAVRDQLEGDDAPAAT